METYDEGDSDFHIAFYPDKNSTKFYTIFLGGKEYDLRLSNSIFGGFL